MSNSKISIKCHFEGAWRRFAIQNSFYTELISTIKEIFTVESQNELVTYYVDSEGDEVRFSSDHELQQAINFFVKVESSYTLKMYVKMTEVKSNPVSTQQNLASSQHQVPSATHGGVRCDYCQQKPIQGVRFKCVICPDFDLCESCEKLHISIGDHLYYHPMLKMFRPMNLAGAYIRNENEETLVGFIPEQQQQQQQQQQLSPNARSHVQVSPKTEVTEKLEESYQKISIGTETDFALTENVQTQTHETQSSMSVLSSPSSASNQIKKVLRSNSISSCGSDSLSYCSATFSERQEQKQQEFDEEQTQQDKSFSISNLSMESSYESQNTNTQELSQNKDTGLSLMAQYINGFWRLQGTDLMIRVFEEENEFKLSLGQDVLDVKNLTENSFVIEWSSKAPSTFVRKESIPNALIEKDRRIWVRTSQPIISTPTITEPTTTTSPFSWRAKPGRFSARRETSNSQENRNSFDLSENGNMNNTSVFVEESKKQETFSVPTSPSLSGKGSIAQSYIELESEQPQFELIGEGSTNSSTNSNSNSNEEDSNSGTTNSSSTSNAENNYSQSQEIQTKEKGQQSSQDLDSEWERINPNQEDESQQSNQQNEVEVVKVKFEPSPELSKIEGWEKLLDQLKEMGFDHDENFKIGLLIEHEGRLQEVVNRLISN